MDHKNFTQLGNETIKVWPIVALGLYIKMKAYGGKNGECRATATTLMKGSGIGREKYNKTILFLLDQHAIFKSGFQYVSTPGGVQKVQNYKIKVCLEPSQGIPRTAPIYINTKDKEKVCLESHTLTKEEKEVKEKEKENAEKDKERKDTFFREIKEKYGYGKGGLCALKSIQK